MNLKEMFGLANKVDLMDKKCYKMNSNGYTRLFDNKTDKRNEKVDNFLWRKADIYDHRVDLIDKRDRKSPCL
jgi:hypothetical protein